MISLLVIKGIGGIWPKGFEENFQFHQKGVISVNPSME